jgi:hypothetical protein
MRIVGHQNFVGGLLFAGIGGIALFLARAYPVGTATRFGPGMLARLGQQRPDHRWYRRDAARPHG